MEPDYHPAWRTTPARWIKRRLPTKLCRMLAIFLVVVVTVNIVLILDVGRKLKLDSGRAMKSLGSQEPRWLVIDVLSSRSRVSVTVDSATIMEEEGAGVKGRGIHVLVLNEISGAVMARRLYDTYSPRQDEALALFLNLITAGRIIILAIKDEGTYHMKQPLRNALQQLGSLQSQIVSWRDQWVLVVQKQDNQKGRNWCEQLNKSPDFQSWAPPVNVRCRLPLTNDDQWKPCLWPDTEENRRRREFCDSVEGYGSVCHCHQPAPIIFHPKPIANNRIGDVPVAVIASNRPQYLYRMLRSLLTSHGCNESMVTVFIDGYYEEPRQVARLFDVSSVQHRPQGRKSTRISQHYKASLSALFRQRPQAQYAIILEEDLDVAPDFFSYFNQLMPLLDKDPSVYCISAWNDQGYRHSTSNEHLLYRVETMPGLGWMLTSRLFKEELEPAWPTQDKMWDWDMWMRKPSVRKNRECIIPDVPRTYHFGVTGVNMNSYFHESHFRQRAINNMADVQLHHIDQMDAVGYEKLVASLISTATVLDTGSRSPCQEDFIPDVQGRVFVLYVQMENGRDTSTWLSVAKCLKMWDLDARGAHKSMWRFHLKGNAVLVVGVPHSPYSRWKADGVVPYRAQLPPPTKAASSTSKHRTSSVVVV